MHLTHARQFHTYPIAISIDIEVRSIYSILILPIIILFLKFFNGLEWPFYFIIFVEKLCNFILFIL